MHGCFLSLHQGNPLHIAARRGDMDALKRLVNKGTDVNTKDDDGVRLWNCDFSITCAILY